MGTIVNQVIATLRDAGIRADEAYPGGRIPALTGPVAAVRLGKVDRSVRSTNVQIVIMSPAAAGGSLCEAAALRAVDSMQAMGGTCIKDICKFDEMADVFYVEISVEFFGTVTADSWDSGPGFSVRINIQAMPHVVSFGSERKKAEDAGSLYSAKWQFTLEELLPPGTSEPPDPPESFTLSVVRSNYDEIFRECRWLSVQRQDTLRGIRQVRTGEANIRDELSIL